MDLDLGDRKIVFSSLIGSYNYNLNDENSDKDYKVFIAPNFDDLYTNFQFHKQFVTSEEDNDVHDIRGLSRYWWQANINFLEVLFSEEIKISATGHQWLLISKLLDMKDDVVKMNLPYLFNACIGMHMTKKKQIDKGTEGTKHLVEKYGYDTKQAMHSIRALDFLIRFAENGFKDFKKAIWYDSCDPMRTEFFAIKNGKYSKEAYYIIAEKYLQKAMKYEDLYLAQEPNEETNATIISIIKEIIKSQMF